jgi:RecB family exonuclease
MEEAEQRVLDRYSYSKIACFKQCHFKWYLKYHEKNYLYSANIATDFGSLVHSIEEDIAKALQAEQPVDYITLKNRFILESRKIALKYPTEFFSKDKSDRTYQEKVYLYLDSAIYRLERFIQQHPELRIIGIEQKFEYNYDNMHSFNGSIDRAFLNTVTGEVLIQDIKTWSVQAQKSDLKAPLQFAIYMMAAQNLWNIPLSKIKCEYDLPLCDKTQAALSDNIVDEGKEILDKLFKDIHAEDFKPTITALCHWCEYNPLTNPSIIDTKPSAVCPYFSTWQKSGDNVRDTLIKWQGLESVMVDRQLCISQLKQQNIGSRI